MSTLKHRRTRVGIRIGVSVYRTLEGRFSSGKRGVHVLMVTTPGRRTGVPRSSCVRYLDTPHGYLVWGTGSGSPRDPDWFRNLRAVPDADVQLRDRRQRVRVRELVGAERDTVWTDVVQARAPVAEKYARRAGRVIPVAVLTPLPGQDATDA